MEAWRNGEADILGHIDPAVGIASLTYYEEMADPPEAHPAVGPDGFVKIARTECSGFEGLLRVRGLMSLSPEVAIECTGDPVRCSYPSAEGGFTYIFVETEGELRLDAFLHLDGGYNEAGQRLQDEWVADHLEDLRMPARTCPAP